MDNKTGTPFQYVVFTAALGAAAASIVPLSIDQDSFFVLQSYAGMGSVDNTTDSEPNSFTVQIQESTGKLYMNQPMPQRLICPRQKTIFLPTIEIAPGTNLQFSFVNLGGAGNTITFALLGLKRFS